MLFPLAGPPDTQALLSLPERGRMLSDVELCSFPAWLKRLKGYGALTGLMGSRLV
ncbi:hypothetical protein [Mumia zhuanghuii]|uniref:hypothetical protein n=1 Tax=Mumia zhuanghuii TaxID=2585211 RepID=UPI00129CCC00|nr:hypothetical protein [Mumia zhuanghuii]